VVKDDTDRLSVLRRELRSRLGDKRYELWLGAQTSLALDGETLRVRCSSQAELQWFRRKLSAAIADSVTVAFERSLVTVFEAADESGAKRGDVQRELFDAAGTEGESPEQPVTSAEAVESGACQTPVGSSASLPSQGAKTPRLSFEDFVVGSANRLAWQAAREVAQQPGRFSPLMFYGPSGTGKSHLLSAVARQVRTARTRLRVLQLTAEQFTTQFLEALEKRALPGFRQKIRSLDVLLIDDVQFFGGKRATLEELLYTIDALHARGGQVVLVSDRAAAELNATSAELANRISAGLAVAVDPPDYATRAGIVRTMSERMQISLEQTVVEAVAQQVVGSGRLLSGAINRLVAASMAAGKAITLELAEPALADFCRQHSPQVKLADIQRAVCEVFGVESSSLKSQRKTRSVAEPRMLAMWLARRYTRAALSEIGDFFGRRSHSTVVSAQKKFDKLISQHGAMVVGDQSCPVEEAIRRIEAKLRTA
jgi:chromosomal replication initiator protein